MFGDHRPRSLRLSADAAASSRWYSWQPGSPTPLLESLTEFLPAVCGRVSSLDSRLPPSQVGDALATLSFAALRIDVWSDHDLAVLEALQLPAMSTLRLRAYDVAVREPFTLAAAPALTALECSNEGPYFAGGSFARFSARAGRSHTFAGCGGQDVV